MYFINVAMTKISARAHIVSDSFCKVLIDSYLFPFRITFCAAHPGLFAIHVAPKQVVKCFFFDY